MSRLKQLGRDTLIYGFGALISKSINFFLLPVYTRILTPSEFGTIELITVLSYFLGSIIVMGSDTAQSVYFYKFENQGLIKQSELVSSIVKLRLTIALIIILFLTLFSPYLSNLFFMESITPRVFWVALFGSIFTQIYAQSTEVLRLLFKPYKYILIIFFKTITTCAFIIFLILVLDLGIYGYFLGSLISCILVSLLGWYAIRRYLRFDIINFNLWPDLIRFGYPLFLSTMINYLMSTSDRLFIKYFFDSKELAIFAVAAKFSMLVSLTVATFRTAWSPIAMKEMHKSGGETLFQMISRIYMGFSCVLIICLTYISPLLIRLLTTSAYEESIPIIGVISWQAIFFGFYSIICVGLLKEEKTYISLPISILALLFGIVLNFFLVPKFAGLGASIATAITYAFWIILTMIYSNKYWKIKYNYVLFSFQILIALFSYILITIAANILPSGVLFGYVLCSCFGIVSISLQPKEKTILASKIRGAFNI